MSNVRLCRKHVYILVITRRQIAKLNHRLMAVELENQQQQQREMVLTVVVTAYFVVKALVWFNKNM